MKIKFEKAISIQGVGTFVRESSWNGFSKYIDSYTSEYIITFEGQCFFEAMLSIEDEISIIASSNGIKNKLKELK